MTNNTIPITVLMSVYNGEKFLKESIDSIINQTYRNWKLFIIDDNSQDNSKKIISNYINRK